MYLIIDKVDGNIEENNGNKYLFPISIDENKDESYLCNGSHNLTQKAMTFNDVAIVYIKGNAYGIHFWYISRDDAISIMNNSNLINKKGVFNFFTIYKK